MLHRKLVAEAVGTALLVFLAVGVATLSFGFKLTGSSTSAGVVATAFSFGLVLLALAYTLGPVSGCHINPAVTMGFLVSGRMKLTEAVEFWVAQFIGGILGALALWGIFSGAPSYSTSTVGSAPMAGVRTSRWWVSAWEGRLPRRSSSPSCSCWLC